MSSVLQLDRVFYSYRSGWLNRAAHSVLVNINLEVEPGSITGLLGKNGAGKTTLLHCALGLLRTDQGTCSNFGSDSWDSAPEVRQRIGFVPQVFTGYEWMTVDEITKHWGAFYESWDPHLVRRLIDQLELPTYLDIWKLSEGQKQKVSIILAMGHRPDLLVLDEPVAGLDPSARRAFLEILLDQYMDEKKTVLFSTHILSDLERVTANVILLKDRSVALHESLDDLKQNVVRIRIIDQANIAQIIASIPHKLSENRDANSAVVTVSKLDRTLLEKLPNARVEQLNLEEVFLELER